MPILVPNGCIIFPTWERAEKVAAANRTTEEDPKTLYLVVPRTSGGFLVLVTVDGEEVGTL